MSLPAPLAGLSKVEQQEALDAASIADLDWEDRYERDRSRQCWADCRGYTWSQAIGDVCVTQGPFPCPLGLCPVHCKEVHVCANRSSMTSSG